MIAPVVKNRPFVMFGSGVFLFALLWTAVFVDNGLNSCAVPGRAISYEDCGRSVRAHLAFMSTAWAPLAGVSIGVPALLVLLATWRRAGGAHLFARTDAAIPRRITTNVLAVVLLLPLGFFTLQGAWFSIAAIAGLPAATGGEFYTDPDLVRGPVQVTPIVSIFLIVWVLALRAIALSEARPSR